MAQLPKWSDNIKLFFQRQKELRQQKQQLRLNIIVLLLFCCLVLVGILAPSSVDDGVLGKEHWWNRFAARIESQWLSLKGSFTGASQKYAKGTGPGVHFEAGAPSQALLTSTATATSFHQTNVVVNGQAPNEEKPAAILNLEKQILGLLDKGNYKQATEILKGQLNDSNFRYLAPLLSQVYYENDEPQKAIELLKEYLDQFPNDKKAKMQLAKSFALSENYQDAVDYFKQIAEGDPKDTESLDNMSSIYLVQNNFEKAKEALEQIISRNPDHMGSYSTYAAILEQEGKKEDAVETYKKALARNPEEWDMRLQMANLQVTMSDSTHAIENYDYVAKNPRASSSVKIEAMSSMAKLLLKDGRSDEALKYAKQVQGLTNGQDPETKEIIRQLQGK